MRGDLADVRLAGQVFAPHYAEPMMCRVERAVDLRDARADGTILARLAPGDPFEVLELAGDHAWGTAPSHGLVGYVDRDALARAQA